MNKNILEYQKIDGEMISIEKALKKNDARMASVKLTQTKQQAEERLVKLEVKAGDLSVSLANILDSINLVKGALEEHLKSVEDLQDIEEIKYLKKKIAVEMDTLDNHDKILKSIIDEVNSVNEQYKVIYDKLPKAIEQLGKANDAFNKVVAEMRPKIEKLKEDKKAIEKTIEPSLLKEYKKVREQNIFPVFVPLGKNNSCGGCMMTTMVDNDELNSVGYFKCENCNRRLYLE